MRFIPSLPGYQYAVDENGLFVNLYVAGTAKVAVRNNTITVRQETKYPWDGRVKLNISPEKSGIFSIGLRIPGWSRDAKIVVNSKPVESPKVVKGYAQLRRMWQAGDVIELDLPMPIERIQANPNVQADVGRVAIQRGPIVYCIEAVDNGGSTKDIVLAREPNLTAQYRSDLLGGVTVIDGVANGGRRVMAVPYYAWDHRKSGEMVVWLLQDGTPTVPATDPVWDGDLYRPIK